jgi:hypothetical protein
MCMLQSAAPPPQGFSQVLRQHPSFVQVYVFSEGVVWDATEWGLCKGIHRLDGVALPTDSCGPSFTLSSHQTGSSKAKKSSRASRKRR